MAHQLIDFERHHGTCPSVQEQQALVGGANRIIRYGDSNYDGDGDDDQCPMLAEPAHYTTTFTHSMDADVVESTGYETDEAI